MTTATSANTASWIQMPGETPPEWPQKTSAKYNRPAKTVTRPAFAGGIRRAVTATRITYRLARSLSAPPVMCTTAVIRTTSNSAWGERKGRPGTFRREAGWQDQARGTPAAVPRQTDLQGDSSRGGA